MLRTLGASVDELGAIFKKVLGDVCEFLKCVGHDAKVCYAIIIIRSMRKSLVLLVTMLSMRNCKRA